MDTILLILRTKERRSGMRSFLVGPFVATVIVLSGCSSPSVSAPVSVSVTPSSPQATDQGVPVALKATVANDTSAKGVAWSLSGPGTIAPPTGPSTTYNSVTTPITSAQQATVTATSVADPTKTASVQITVNPDPAIPISQTLANGTVGVPYSQPITLMGGTAPFQWSIYNGPILSGAGVGGAVPDGLTLNAATGTISGTPTAAGTWYFEAAVTDAVGEAAVDGFLSIEISPASAVTANAVPFLNQPLMPSAVSPGGGAITLSMTGTGFAPGATIDFNGAPLTTTFVDGEHLSAVVPATDLATARTASVTVVNPAPGGASNVASFQVGPQESAVSFKNAANSPLQVSEPSGLAIGDFNQDGKPDLAIAANVRLYTLLSNGDGTFTPALGSPVSMPSPPYNTEASPYTGPLTVGDFNHSGHPGLAVGLPGNGAAVILLGNGNGSFVTSSAVFANSPGAYTSAVEAADFNADGNLDLALTNSFTGLSVVDLGYGKGAFNTAGNLNAGSEGFPAGAAVGDFNGDGKLDVATANGGSTTYPNSGVTVSLGNGDGTFRQANSSPISLGQDLSAIIAGDFNGDGKLDLAVTDYGANTVFILLGNGNGTFQPPTSIAVGNEPYALVAGDFNNDGKLDLAVANYGGNSITLLLGNGNGTFVQASGSPYAVGDAPSAIVAADFNGDGKLDLAVANSADGTISILLQ